MSFKDRAKAKTKKLIESKHMLKSIALASFLESTIVPIPLEAVLVPLMQARREKLWRIAFMATLGCVLGAVFGYGLGYFLFDFIGDWIINTFSDPQEFEAVKQKMQQQGFWFVLTLGIAPIPFQIAMLAAGATGYSLLLFVFATVIARSIRYFGLAGVVYFAGDKAEDLLRRYKLPSFIILTVLFILVWWITTLL